MSELNQEISIEQRVSNVEEALKECIEAVGSLLKIVDVLDGSNDRLRNLIAKVINRCMVMEQDLLKEINQIKDKTNN